MTLAEGSHLMPGLTTSLSPEMERSDNKFGEGVPNTPRLRPVLLQLKDRPERHSKNADGTVSPNEGARKSNAFPRTQPQAESFFAVNLGPRHHDSAKVADRFPFTYTTALGSDTAS